MSERSEAFALDICHGTSPIDMERRVLRYCSWNALSAVTESKVRVE